MNSDETLDKQIAALDGVPTAKKYGNDRVIFTTDRKVNKLILKAKISELQERKSAIQGVGSRGDKVNGDPKFMMGIEVVEEHLAERIADLSTQMEKL